MLNTLELSVLSGSLAGSNENAILEIDGEVSPSVRFQKSGDKSVLCNIEESNGRKVYAKSGMKNVKDQKLFSTPEVPFQEEKQAQVVGCIMMDKMQFCCIVEVYNFSKPYSLIYTLYAVIHSNSQPTVKRLA